MSVCLSILCSSVNLFVSRLTSLQVSLSVSLSVTLPDVSLFVYSLSVFQSLCPFFNLCPVCRSVCTVSLSVYISMSVFSLLFCLSVTLSVYPCSLSSCLCPLFCPSYQILISPLNNVVSSSRNLYINFLSYTLFKRYYDVTPACYFCILLLHVIVFSCCCMLLLRVMLHILIARSCCMLFHTSEDISFFPNNVSSYTVCNINAFKSHKYHQQ